MDAKYAAVIKLANEGNTEDAKRIVSDMLRANPGDFLALAIRGFMLIREDQLVEGVEAFSKALFGEMAEVPKTRLLRSAYKWRNSDPQSKSMLINLAAATLPLALLRLGRRQEAGEIYRDALELGFSYWHYNPQWGLYSILAELNPTLSSWLLQRDRDRYAAVLDQMGSVATWSPVIEPDGTVTLRGATAAALSAASQYVFLAWEKRDHTLGACLKFDAISSPEGAGTRAWTSTVSALPRGVEILYQLSPINAPMTPHSQAHSFVIPAATERAATTVGAEVVGRDHVTFFGEVASTRRGTRYRFEYGTDPQALSNTTPWQDVPPPRTGRVRDLAYRHPGHWSPRSTDLSWKTLSDGDGPSVESANCPALELKGPFHKDRNQLNGIGTHDVPLIFDWGKHRQERAGYNPGSATFSVDGGMLDLRDAEIAISVQAKELEDHGSSLIFWACSFDKESGATWSEWALTDSPVPEMLLHDEKWHTVTFHLRCAPFTWTYTGSNPLEQGKHADRHQRFPIAETLEKADGPFVLDFALGDERKTPVGSLRLFDVTGRYRSHSLLSAAAGTRLVKFPRSGLCDPLNLSNASRGFDHLLWTSDALPSYPLEFEWAFASLTHVTHFQLNQHPYWPAREVEITGSPDGSESHLIWTGTLPEGRADRREASYLRVRLENPRPLVSLRLRILSGYHGERCGLDGLEVFGTGPAFFGDGQACSIAAEISHSCPGRSLHYRVVVEDQLGVKAGDTKAIAIPTTPAPLLHFAKVLRRSHEGLVIKICANPMGLESTLWMELAAGNGATEKGKAVSLGEQITSRHIHYTWPKPVGASDRLRIVARNAAGEAMLELMPPL